MRDVGHRTTLRIGPLTFTFLPDGDDPGEGRIRIATAFQTTELQATARDWQRFRAEANR